MSRDFGKEIDSINMQLGEIKDLLAEIIKHPRKDESTKPSKCVEDFMWNDGTDERLVKLHKELCEKTNEKNDSGYITYLGVFSSGDRQSNWILEKNVNMLLRLIESNAAAKVLACIGNNDRLNMLLAILRAPRTAAQLVEECGYNTTGQVYHHLKPLLASDLVKEDDGQRGSYVIQPHRVSGIIMLLAGISDMLDTKYTHGDWEGSSD